MTRTCRLCTLAIAILILTACTSPTPPDTCTISVHTISAKRFYEEALETVRQQQPDAFLVAISVDFRSVADDRPLKLTYHFESPSTPTRSYRVQFTDGHDPGFSITTHPIDEYIPIAEQDWRVDSPEALAIAHDRVGCQFFAKWRSENTRLTLQRKYATRDVARGLNPVEWIIVYDSIVTKAMLEVSVDALSGEITHVSRSEP